jgi:hypothetical protein
VVLEDLALQRLVAVIGEGFEQSETVSLERQFFEW